MRTGSEMSRPLGVSVGGFIAGILLVGCLVYLVLHWLVSRESIGGVDLYFYIVNARDVIHDRASAPLGRYGYFPGVYVFWNFVLRAFGERFDVVQWSVLALLFANAALTGTVVFQSLRNVPAALLASVFYLTYAQQVEGLMGATEPLITVWFLIGVSGYLLAAKSPRVAAIALGIGTGLAIFSKQQGVLLLPALGALILSPGETRPWGKRFESFANACAVISLTLLAAFSLEGGGEDSVMRGLRFAQEYSSQRSFFSNISWFYHLQPFSWCLLVFGGVWLVALFNRSLRELLPMRGWVLASMAVFSLLSIQAQFLRRSYLHYALLGLPQCSILIAVFVVVILRSRWWIQIVGALALGGVSYASVAELREAALNLTETQPKHRDWTTPYEEMCVCLTRGSELFLVPPRQNAVHWYCGTKSHLWPKGYGWGDVIDRAEYLSVIANPKTEAVMILKEAFREGSDFQRVLGETDVLAAEILRFGYSRVGENSIGILFSRSGDAVGACPLR